jgi:hypothetical protein
MELGPPTLMAAKATMLSVTSCVYHAPPLLLLTVGYGGLSSIRVGPNSIITIISLPDVSEGDKVKARVDVLLL